MSNKKLCVSSLVLGIVGLVFSFFIPAVAYGCAIPGVVIGLKKRKKNYRASAGIAVGVTALTVAIINSILGVVMTIKMFFSGKSEGQCPKVK